jgi:hypothetical protein
LAEEQIMNSTGRQRIIEQGRGSYKVVLSRDRPGDNDPVPIPVTDACADAYQTDRSPYESHYLMQGIGIPFSAFVLQVTKKTRKSPRRTDQNV